MTPVAEFLNDIAHKIGGQKVLAAGADRYRRAEMIQAMDEAGQSGPWMADGLAWNGCVK